MTSDWSNKDFLAERNLWASVILDAAKLKEEFYIFYDNRFFVGSFLWICHHLSLDVDMLRLGLRKNWGNFNLNHSRIVDYEKISSKGD